MELAADSYARVPVKPGVRAYLRQCKAEGRRMAVVTSSPAGNARGNPGPPPRSPLRSGDR